MRTMAVDALRMVGPRTAQGRLVEYLAYEWSRMELPFDRIVLMAPRPVELPSLGSTTPDSPPPPKTRHNPAGPGDQVELLRCPGLRPEPVAPSGQSGRHVPLTPLGSVGFVRLVDP